jgi:hypothetical protein
VPASPTGELRFEIGQPHLIGPVIGTFPNFSDFLSLKEIDMTKHIRPWTGEDIKTLRNLAQKLPATTIATQLNRSPSALAAKAYELKLSLRVNKSAQSGVDPGPAGFNLSK